MFNKLYFPHAAPATGTLLAFASFGIGFVARPLGGLFFGYFGDRIGRNNMLIATLLLVGGATLLIGCIPSYALIGPTAPVLLVTLRLVQGFGVGGEYGGAVIYAVEHAPPGKRGWFGSWSPMGVSLGTLLAAVVFAAVSTLPEPQFLSWGWSGDLPCRHAGRTRRGERLTCNAAANLRCWYCSEETRTGQSRHIR